MDSPITDPMPRRELRRGEVAVGQVAVGPGNFWRVPLDTATMRWEDDAIAITGLETRIACQGNTIIRCLQEFWKEFGDLVCRLEERTLNLDWLPDEEKRSIYADVMIERFTAVLATPPSDGDAPDLLAEFWDGKCPREKNSRPVRLVFPPF